eukprot:15474735-Alexandrium_andersonii.AAC.1
MLVLRGLLFAVGAIQRNSGTLPSAGRRANKLRSRASSWCQVLGCDDADVAGLWRHRGAEQPRPQCRGMLPRT